MDVVNMRTVVTEDIHRALRLRMADKRKSLEVVVAEVLRAGLAKLAEDERGK